MNRAILTLNTGYRKFLRQLLRFKFITVLVFLFGLGLTYWVYQRVPRAFVPEEDQGWFMIAAQAPEGASLEYTTRICEQVEDRKSTRLNSSHRCISYAVFC